MYRYDRTARFCGRSDALALTVMVLASGRIGRPGHLSREEYHP
jgi:hypothetical protein